MRCEGLDRRLVEAKRPEFGDHLVFGLAQHQRFGLCQHVGDQLVVMRRQLLMRIGGDEEIGGDHVGPLVDKLIKGVLAIGAGLAPDDRSGRVVHRFAGEGHRFAVRLHILLLQVGGEARQALVVGQHGVGREPPGVAIPDAQHGHDRRQVTFQRRREEMLVHRMGAVEQAREIIETHRQCDRHADGGPHRIAAADPIPEAENAVWLDAEGGAGFEIGGESREVVVDRGIAELPRNPGPRGGSIGHGLVGSEGLGGDDDHGPFRI